MKRICLMHTGGTISMVKNEAGVLQPAGSGEHVLEYVPAIQKIAKIDNIFLFQLDSSDVNPRHWRIIAETIGKHYHDYDGFVILHGTDTMGYTATALSFMLGNLSKPVILTGAQLPISEIASDGVNNLINAVRFACQDITEVAIMFGNHLLRGNRATKISHFSLDGFVSPNCLPLSVVGTELRLADHCIVRRSKELQVLSHLVTDVAVIKVFPGITNQFILGMIPTRTRGVILEAYGTGNFPLGEEGIQDAVDTIITQGIIMVIGTQCVYDGVEYEQYQGGFFAKEHGALTAQDMTSEATMIKLMWCLGQSNDADEIRRLYQSNLVGELTEREQNHG